MGDAEKEAISRLRCDQIMTGDVRTVSPETSIRDVALQMRKGDIGAIPIVSDSKLVGIITDRDIVIRAVAEGADFSATVGDIMTTKLFTVSPKDFVFEAIRLMGNEQVRRIPVVNDDGSLAGIIAMADVALEMEDEREIAETLEEISSGAAFWHKK